MLNEDEEEENEEARLTRQRAIDDATDNFFVELCGYLEDLADPTVRETINQVTDRTTTR